MGKSDAQVLRFCQERKKKKGSELAVENDKMGVTVEATSQGAEHELKKATLIAKTGCHLTSPICSNEVHIKQTIFDHWGNMCAI